MEKWLTPAALERAQECVWDAVNKRVITKDEVMADKALDDSMDDHWLFKLPAEMGKQGEGNQVKEFLPLIPSGGSISTFDKTATQKPKLATRYAPGFNPPRHGKDKESEETGSTVSSLSGRVSHMEREVNDINSKLDKLLEIHLAAARPANDGRKFTQINGQVTPTADGNASAARVQ